MMIEKNTKRMNKTWRETKDNNKLSYFVASSNRRERKLQKLFFKEKEKNAEKRKCLDSNSVCFIVYYLINEILTFYPPQKDLHRIYRRHVGNFSLLIISKQSPID
jgi:hypothetical protein